ncbi:MAG: ABC transporter permease subunit [Actinomycetota bacterium]|nr:ABC transporter permease subunit [Actinomycetota bacterium]
MKPGVAPWFWVMRASLTRITIFALVAVILVVPSLSFLIQAISPRLLGQGPSWITWSNVSEALSFGMGRAVLDSLWVSLAAALVGTVAAAGMAYVAERTRIRGRGLFVIGLWAVLLCPSYLIAVGWEEIVVRSGLLGAAGLWSSGLQHLIMGPAGVALVLAFKGTPFAYFALAPSLSVIGGDLEHAARVHGGRRLGVLRTVGPVLLPAVMSGFIIVFAESIGDFGVATTIAASAHFPVATYFLYESIGSFPANFGEAAVVGWTLVIAVGGALLVQSLLLRGRSFAVLSGRTKPAPPRDLTWRGHALALIFVIGFFLLALGVPLIGVVSSSLLVPFEGIHWSSFTFSNYSGLLGVQGLGGPIRFSGEIALVCAVTVVALGGILARTLANGGGRAVVKLLDLALLMAVALPGVVFAAGYIFAYDMPIVTNLGIVLYGTVPLLGMAYVANAVPQSTRILLGPFAQVQASLLAAARVHGASSARAWRKGVLPLLSRPIVWAALLAFSSVFLELPISELLAPPGVIPVSVAILRVLGKADIGLGTALSVAAVLFTLLVVALVLGAFRLFAPAGWREWHQTEERIVGRRNVEESQGLAEPGELVSAQVEVGL